MPCHHIILYGMLINVHETPMKLSLGVVLDCLQQSTQRATQTQKRSRTVLLPTKHTLQQTTQSEHPFCVQDKAEHKYASPLSATQSLAHVVVGPWRRRREAAWPTSRRRRGSPGWSTAGEADPQQPTRQSGMERGRRNKC